MPSQAVLRFRRQTQPTIAGALETAEEVAGSLAEIYDGLLEEGEQRVDWTLVQKLASRRLARQAVRLAEVDARLEVQRTSDKELREERDRSSALLRSELRAVRLLLDESFGKQLSAGLFRWRNLSQVTPAALVPVAREAATSLRSSPMLAQASLALTGAFSEPTALADALDRRASELEQKLEVLTPNKKREIFEVGEKGQERQEAYSARLRSQDLLFGLYRAAGKDHLAQRLRPKARVAATSQEGGKAAAAKAAAPAAEGTAADAAT